VHTAKRLAWDSWLSYVSTSCLLPMLHVVQLSSSEGRNPLENISECIDQIFFLSFAIRASPVSQPLATIFSCRFYTASMYEY